MHTPETIFPPLRTIVAMSLQIPEDEVKSNSNLKDELDAESIDLLDIRFGIEQEFGFKFDDAEIKSMLEKVTKNSVETAAALSRLLTVKHFLDYILYKTNPEYYADY